MTRRRTPRWNRRSPSARAAHRPNRLTDEVNYPGAVWGAASPDDVGWSSASLDAARALTLEIDSDAVFVAARGVPLASWGATNARGLVRSVRKSLLSALYGCFIDEGVIDLHATLADLGIDDDPPLTSTEKRATVEHLLQSRSGVYHEAAAMVPSQRQLMPARGSHEPGEFFYYNNWDFNALGTIFTRLTGLDIFSAFRERIADPLQMEDFVESECFYDLQPGSTHPAYKFSLSARDMARFGLLYLTDGRWRDVQVIPSAWVRKSTSAHSSDVGGGYGYLWRIGDAADLSGNRYYYASGAWHRITVVPELKLVVVHRKFPLADATTHAVLVRLTRILCEGSPS